MTTSYTTAPNIYYTSDGGAKGGTTTRFIPRKQYVRFDENNTNFGANTLSDGDYNVIEQDYGDKKVIYHVPVEYGDDYDLSQIDESLAYEQPPIRTVRRRVYQHYDDDDDGYAYADDAPIITPRRRVYASPTRHQPQPQVIKRTYYEPPPPQTVEYVYEDDYSDDYYDYEPEQETEEVEYVVRERPPRRRYIEPERPVRRTVYVVDPPAPPPVSYSPRRSPTTSVVPHRSSPRVAAYQAPTPPRPPPERSIRRNEPPLSTRRHTVRTPIREPPPRITDPKNGQKYVRAMDIIMENRAKRGSRIPKPRREVDEQEFHDPPTYNRNIIKNGFIVHK